MMMKFTLGDDPYDQSKIITSLVMGLQTGEVIPDKRIRHGNPIFDPTDYNTFFMGLSKDWEFTHTMDKFTFVPGGEAIVDLNWGGWNVISEWYNANWDGHGGFLNNDAERNLFWNINGKNPLDFPNDRLVAWPMDDPSDVLLRLNLMEFYYPNGTADADGVVRTGAEAGRLDKGPKSGQFYMSGDAACVLELMDAHKIIDGADQPFATDGSGYVVWCNSNGDYFGDKNTYADAVDPHQIWSCVSFEPRNFNNMRTSPSPTLGNDFSIWFMDFAALYACGGMTQDGTGIEYWRFADDAFTSGGENTQKKGNGWTLDVGVQYDGIYTPKPMQSEPSYGNVIYHGMCWFGQDNDGGIISNLPVAVEEDAPVAFSVAQNTPNPFNPTTTINFNLASEGQVSVDVFNIAGQKVDTLVNDVMNAGSHSVAWDANGFAAGVYFYTVKSGDYAKTMKMTLLK